MFSNKKINFATIVLLGIATLAVLSPTISVYASDKPITLKVATYVSSATHFARDIMDPWCREIEKRTNGRIKVQKFYGGALYSAKEQVEQIAAGTADFDPNWVSSYAPGLFPMMRLVASPFLFANTHIASRVAEELFAKYSKKQFDRAGVMMGWLAPYGLYVYIGSTPARTMQDFRGLKIRTSGGVKAKVMEKAYGVTAIRLPSSESYMAMQRKLVDGILTDISQIISHSYYEVGKHVTLFGGHGFAAVMGGSIMNKKTYNSLPKDIQRILYELNREATYWWSKSYEGNPEEDIPFIQKQGVELTNITDKELTELKEKAIPVIEEEIESLEKKGYPAREFYNEFKERCEQYNDMSLEEFKRMQKEHPVSMSELGY